MRAQPVHKDAILKPKLNGFHHKVFGIGLDKGHEGEFVGSLSKGQEPRMEFLFFMGQRGDHDIRGALIGQINSLLDGANGPKMQGVDVSPIIQKGW